MKSMNTLKQEEERRINSRRDCSIKVSLKSGENIEFTSDATNMSAGGVFVKTNDPLPAGSVITLEFTIPAVNKTVSCRGLVIWECHTDPLGDCGDAAGMGIRMLNLSAQEFKFISDYFDSSS